MNHKILKAGLSIILILSHYSCQKAEPEPSPPRPAYTLKVGGPGVGEVRSFSGIAKAQRDIAMSFRVPGQIIELNAKVGQKIKPGDVIARLDPKDAELEVSQKQAALADSEAQLQKATANYERVRKLYESGSSSARELDSALATYRSERANRDAAQKALELTQQQLSYTNLVSDVDAEITAKNAEIFETVAAGQSIVEVMAGDEIKMEIGVPENLVNYLFIGMPATIIFDSFPSKTFEAHINELGRSPTEATTYPVKLVIDHPIPEIRPGMVGEVTFRFSQPKRSNKILVPPSVVVGGIGDLQYVWVVNPKTNEIEKRKVVVGTLDINGLEILDGLVAGDLVLTRGVHRITEGTKVRPISDEKAKKEVL